MAFISDFSKGYANINSSNAEVRNQNFRYWGYDAEEEFNTDVSCIKAIGASIINDLIERTVFIEFSK